MGHGFVPVKASRVRVTLILSQLTDPSNLMRPTPR
jgi:hypothetical protein